MDIKSKLSKYINKLSYVNLHNNQIDKYINKIRFYSNEMYGGGIAVGPDKKSISDLTLSSSSEEIAKNIKDFPYETIKFLYTQKFKIDDSNKEIKEKELYNFIEEEILKFLVEDDISKIINVLVNIKYNIDIDKSLHYDRKPNAPGLYNTLNDFHKTGHLKTLIKMCDYKKLPQFNKEFQTASCKADTDAQKSTKLFEIHDSCKTKFDPIGRDSNGNGGYPMYQFKIKQYAEKCPENQKPKIDVDSIIKLMDEIKDKLKNNKIKEEEAKKLRTALEATLNIVWLG